MYNPPIDGGVIVVVSEYVLKNLEKFTGGVLILQIGVFVGDLWIYWGLKSFFAYPFEIFCPYVLIPGLKKILSRMPETLSKDLVMLGDFSLVLAGLMVLALVGFQILSWFIKGPLTGGVFYIPSLILAFLWGMRVKTTVTN